MLFAHIRIHRAYRPGADINKGATARAEHSEENLMYNNEKNNKYLMKLNSVKKPVMENRTETLCLPPEKPGNDLT